MAKKQRIGVVYNTKMNKTVSIGIQMRLSHPKYLKTIFRTIRYLAHDEKNKCKKGDIVLIEQTRPLSKLKRWQVKDILQKSNNPLRFFN